MKAAVFGAGVIGTYIGTSLLGAGVDVVLIGRQPMRDRIAAQGVQLSDPSGHLVSRAPDTVAFALDARAMTDVDLILVCVKSADTAAAAAAISEHGKPHALVISFQNGVHNATELRHALPGRQVLAGMVPFNVVQLEDGRLHRATEGELMVEASLSLAPWLQAFADAHLPLVEHTDFLNVQWGKLLLNLNNAVNAISGLPLKSQLSQLAYRRPAALLIDEALGVLDAAGIKPAKIGRVTPKLIPPLLRLPDFLFTRAAGAMLRIDPQARTSMAADLKSGRATEVDYLNGEVVKLAASLGRAAPFNQRICELVHLAEAMPADNLSLDGETLYRDLLASARTQSAPAASAQSTADQPIAPAGRSSGGMQRARWGGLH